MGYTHYFYQKPSLDPERWNLAVADIREVFAMLGTMGVKLAGPQGTGFVELATERIAFNGVQMCGHKNRDLGITWPANTQDTGGVGTKVADERWFAGALLMERTCGGDCSHESFWLTREYKIDPAYKAHADEAGRLFSFCKTAYKPYDLAVTAALIILKRHLGDAIAISSDGENKDWRDAGMICQMVLGYGANFTLDEARS